MNDLEVNFSEVINMIETRRFYETYKDYPIVSPLVTQNSWTNNLIILSATNTMEEKNFILKCV